MIVSTPQTTLCTNFISCRMHNDSFLSSSLPAPKWAPNSLIEWWMIVVCERMTNSCLFTCCLGRRLFGVATSCNFDLEVSLDKTRTPCTHCRLVLTLILSQYVASFIFYICLFSLNLDLVCKIFSSFKLQFLFYVTRVSHHLT